MSEISNPHILFISRQPPRQGTGSHIIIERHLKRLEDSNWKISIVAPENTLAKVKLPNTWNVISLPKRRWWWPAFRKHLPLSLKIRIHCWEWECKNNLKNTKISAILADYWDDYSLLAAFLSKKWNIPLSLIIHDQPELWAASKKQELEIAKRTKLVINQAQRIWCVSQELADAYRLNLNPKTRILLPISNGNFLGLCAEKQPSNLNKEFVIAHAGSLHPFQYENFKQIALCLQKINGVFLLIAEQENPTVKKLQQQFDNIKHYPTFKSNTEVMSFLAKNAHCLLVSYSFDLNQQPWAATSFPSKLVEFAHLKIPILILAPLNTAISNWAINNNWLGYVSSLEETELIDILNKIKDEETWLKMAKQSTRLALTKFNPDLIQAQFQSEIAII
ncbi:hypothetical protein Sta7437_2608 [Stanieria cyanosphaera PCC 7437]|uniref:Glycosyltransferase subfamily 4-like N-terminal domain-containing protein n=1 Tax=Stanieria cyanosphaera (strain ATCC 29371 / PCC 7437) TaxID=111780 RepID=K9XVP3_STAC7|nr:hypothetical protein [Stanieria cyanosphaera]AFZ36139.1 hypothetical protein Sta7437_2608 [Stanieria cyanosphaera PCC 7437]